MSTAGSFGLESIALLLLAVAVDEVSSVIFGAFSNVGVDGSSCSFFSFNLASNPSTLFKRASSTSVFGPLFFGTASAPAEERSG